MLSQLFYIVLRIYYVFLCFCELCILLFFYLELCKCIDNQYILQY